MTPEQHKEFPTKREFLEVLQGAADAGSQRADEFAAQAGDKLPATLDGLGTVLSLLYRLACCAWGCKGGDHQMEWLAGRVVNQTISAHRLIRSGYYDEALMLIRGIGEIANLLWLFKQNTNEFENWKNADRATRLNAFGPGGVRKRLEASPMGSPPIDWERYQKLCEIGTHPIPAFAPGHYSGTGRPVLGAFLQPVGMFVCITELGFAVALSSIPLTKFLAPNEEVHKNLNEESLNLIKSLGAFTVLNYEQMLEDALTKNEQPSSKD